MLLKHQKGSERTKRKACDLFYHLFSLSSVHGVYCYTFSCSYNFRVIWFFSSLEIYVKKTAQKLILVGIEIVVDHKAHFPIFDKKNQLKKFQTMCGNAVVCKFVFSVISDEF